MVRVLTLPTANNLKKTNDFCWFGGGPDFPDISASIAIAAARRELSNMKRISEEQVRAEASRGKNEPIAKSAKVARQQNGQVEPRRSTARKQPGTDESEDAR